MVLIAKVNQDYLGFRKQSINSAIFKLSIYLNSNKL